MANGHLENSFQIFVALWQGDLSSSLRQRVQRQLRQLCAMYLERAEKGDLPSMRALGAAYEHGWGVTHNFQEAKRWYRDAANAGNVAAMAPFGKTV
jgi:TPR repeat protein